MVDDRSSDSRLNRGESRLRGSELEQEPREHSPRFTATRKFEFFLFSFQRISSRDTAKPKRAPHAGFCRVLPRPPVNFPLDHASTLSVTTLLLGTVFLFGEEKRSVLGGSIYGFVVDFVPTFEILDERHTLLRWSSMKFHLIQFTYGGSLSLIEQSELFIIFDTFCMSLAKL